MSVIEFLQTSLGEGFLGFFLGVTKLGGEAPYIVLLGLYYWLVDPRQGRLLALLLTLSVISNIALKDTFALPRPYLLNPDVLTPEALHTAGTYSFPSGHAQGITTFWGAIACFQQKVWLRLLAVTIIFLVCLSRLYLGVHFPRDVAAGIALGIIGIGFGLWADRREWCFGRPLEQKILIWSIGGLGAIALPMFSELMGIFCGFIVLPSVEFQPPENYRERGILGLSSLMIVLCSYLLLKNISLVLPTFSVIDYARYLLMSLIVTEGIPRLWQSLQPVR